MKTIKELRLERDLTQRELAEEMQVSESLISMYESGQRSPSLKMAVKLSKFFGVTLDDIFFKTQLHSQ